MATNNEENQLEMDFEDVKDKLYVIQENGDIFKLNKLDFDNKEEQTKNLNKSKTGVSNGRSSVLPENKKRSKSDSIVTQKEDSKREDLTEQQVEENYWVETEFSKMDSSTNMMEARISKCQEATGKSREECSKEVKKRMKQNGSENTNTDMKKSAKKKDATEEEDKEEEEDDEEEEEDMKPEKVEICPKKLDMLEKKAKEYDTLMAEKENLKKDLDSFKTDFLAIKKEYEAKKAQEIEAKRQDIIKRLKADFLIPEDKIKADSLEILQLKEDTLNLGLAKTKEKQEEPKKEDFQANMDIMTAKEKELDATYTVKM